MPRKRIYDFREEDAMRFASFIHAKYKHHGNELQFKTCPYCRSQRDEYTFAINLRTGAFNCKRASCGAKGNMITLARDFNFSLGRDVDEYFNSQRTFRDLRKYPKPDARPPAIRYLESRGISEDIVRKYGVSSLSTDDSILVFPFYDEHGTMQTVKYRNTEYKKGESKGHKEWFAAKCKPILYGMDQCDTECKTLVLTEGQIDSLSVAECGIPNAVSVPTGAKGFTWVPYCWDFLGKFDELIVFGDYEDGKISLLTEMGQRFNGTVGYVRPEDYLDCKDANELLLKHGKDAVVRAIRDAERISNPKIKRLADVHRKSMADRECISTGIPALDRKIGGFYFGTLSIITGERGLGKSTLASQFGGHAVKQGHNVFFYSGELMDWYFQEWFDRQCAGDAYINPMVSNLGYTSYLVHADAVEQIHDWYRDRCYLYDNSIVAGDEIADEGFLTTIEKAITQYSCRVLVIDNLMTALEDDLRSDIYRQQTAFVRKLAAYARTYNVIILLIVHPRKAGVNEFTNDDVAGSSNITNLADVVIRYAELSERDTENMAYTPPDRILQVTKNRLNGSRHYGSRDYLGLFFQESSKRISEDEYFGWQMGWEQVDEDGFLSIPDGSENDDIPF